MDNALGLGSRLQAARTASLWLEQPLQIRMWERSSLLLLAERTPFCRPLHSTPQRGRCKWMQVPQP